MKALYIAVSPVASKFAKALQQALRDKVVNKIYRVDHTRAAHHRSRRRDVFQVTPQTLNKVEQLHQFVAAGVSCPKWTTDKNAVTRQELGKTVFARTLINSTGGRGILEINLNDEGNVIPTAPLYTEYIPKKAEYRGHVFNGEVIDVQQKKKKREFEGERDTRVRNLANGYVYTRENIVPPADLADLAVRAVAACNYAYGAVDVIYNEKQNKCFVLEVNSRPGIINSTCISYANAIIAYYGLTRR